MCNQAMPKVMPKKATANHLVVLDRKLDAPRAPNTVPEAPPPKPEPAAAPEPRCIRISAIMAIATSTYTTLTSCNTIGSDSVVRQAAADAMARKSAATSEAPPMSPPSTSPCPKRLAALAGFTLPP